MVTIVHICISYREPHGKPCININAHAHKYTVSYTVGYVGIVCVNGNMGSESPMHATQKKPHTSRNN